MLTREALDAFLQAGATLPIPSEQARNILRMIGDAERATGDAAIVDNVDYAWFGCANAVALELLLKQLMKTEEWVTFMLHDSGARFQSIHLTFKGWKVWEDLGRSALQSKKGFLAMPFGNETLNTFINEVVRPAVATIEGMSIHRVDDAEMSRAGIIDNIMRDAIREAAFVVADLSHGNNGAYWEAGFAEGLGKPVIYLCEQNLWDERRTHFDTNHCTTVVWDAQQPEKFTKQFVATLRNSLRLLDAKSG